MGKWAVAACAALVAASAGADTIAVKAGRIYPVVDKPIENGVVLVRDGKIVEVGRDVRIPDDAKVLEFRDGVVTPGLIDACCMLDSQIEEASPRRVAREGPEFGRVQTPPAEAHGRLPRGVQGDDAGASGGGFWAELAAWAADAERVATDASGEAICECGLAEPHEHEPFAAALEPRALWGEQASEVVPHLRALDSVNLLSNDFKRLLREGVTTVYVCPDPSAVISARGAVVKTAGTLEQRVVQPAAAVRAALGSDPSLRGRPNRPPRPRNVDLHVRRPTTRMGVEWVFRKAFHDARRVRERGAPYGGADTAPAEAFPVLEEILAGQPLRIQARPQHDILTALRLAEEFKLRIVVDEAIEAYRALPQLKAAGVAVVYGPMFVTAPGFRRFTRDADEPRLDTPARLLETGIPFALTAMELRDEEGLVRQAMMAARYGLPAEAALRAITQAPAELLGLAERLGALRPGLDADLVVWSGEPLEATSRPRLVMVNGQVVHAQ